MIDSISLHLALLHAPQEIAFKVGSKWIYTQETSRKTVQQCDFIKYGVFKRVCYEGSTISRSQNFSLPMREIDWSVTIKKKNKKKTTYLNLHQIRSAMLRLFVAFHFDRVGPLKGSASLVLGSCHQLESCHQFHPQTTQWDSAVLWNSEFGDAVTEHVI